MGGITNTVEATTIKELEEKARVWLRPARERGWEIRKGYDREAVRETEDGYEIDLWVHT